MNGLSDYPISTFFEQQLHNQINVGIEFQPSQSYAHGFREVCRT